MAGRNKVNAATAVVLVSLLIVAAATTAGALSLCGVQESEVESCRSYAEVGSQEDHPSPDCCAKLKKLKSNQWNCLCSYKRFLPGDLDADRVMQIPAKCGVTNPPTCAN